MVPLLPLCKESIVVVGTNSAEIQRASPIPLLATLRRTLAYTLTLVKLRVSDAVGVQPSIKTLIMAGNGEPQC